MGILDDFASGKKGEDAVEAILAAAGGKCSSNTAVETRKYWDLDVRLEGVDLTLEVKNDIYANKSGNIALEMFNPRSNKESGLTATRADLWCHIIFPEIWVCRVIELKNFVAITDPFRVIERAGDGNAKLFLYKKDKLMSAQNSQGQDLWVRLDLLDIDAVGDTIFELLDR
jgi:hypothetical protein